MTIEIPTPSTELVSQLETAVIDATASEVAAVAAMRKQFKPYAKHNGYIRIGHLAKFSNSGQEISDTDWFLGKDHSHVREGEAARMHGLFLLDNFTQPNTSEFGGRSRGSRLYLSETGEWIEIIRSGSWSQWQGSTQWWSCGVDLSDDGGDSSEDRYDGGSIRRMTDEEVADEYDFKALCEGLAGELKKMADKLPQRLTKLRARAELAKRFLEAAQ